MKTQQAGEDGKLLHRNGASVLWKFNCRVCHKWKYEIDRPPDQQEYIKVKTEVLLSVVSLKCNFTSFNYRGRRLSDIPW